MREPRADGIRQILRVALRVASATVKMSRASVSIDRPCWAARTRNRALVDSSKRRIVMLAIVALTSA
jgi:hypothetical protein